MITRNHIQGLRVHPSIAEPPDASRTDAKVAKASLSFTAARREEPARSRFGPVFFRNPQCPSPKVLGSMNGELGGDKATKHNTEQHDSVKSPSKLG
jgi:hypothetical protein